jgi:RNA polymerase sigma-70 factor (ECF subfamily)
VDPLEYERIVGLFYESLYRFGLSLARNPDDACELTQETFCRLLTKGSQLRDHSKVKAWLFTTLYRIFLGWKRREVNLPHVEIDSVDPESLSVASTAVDDLDGSTVWSALLELDERFRGPLVLFYLEDQSYRDIAVLLDLPIGTVMSRISRGKGLLRQVLASQASGESGKVVPMAQKFSRPAQS